MTAVGYTSGDPRKVDVAGDTMTGDLVLPADPDQALEAATKQYVDAVGSSGGVPSPTVVTETGFGQASAVGVSTTFARGDHTHGTPAAPTAASVGAAPDTRTITAGTGLSGGGDLTADRTLSVDYGAVAGTAAEGDDARLSDARTPTAHAATHAAGGGDDVTLTQAQITGLATALAALAPLAGATFTGAVIIDGANLTVIDTGTKGYRFRQDGGDLDLEGTGAGLFVSVWSGTNFDGAQRHYLRLESGAHIAHASGVWQFTSSPFAGAVHTIDGLNDQLGFHGETPVSRQDVSGSHGGNAALVNLLTALSNLGLITDSTTP